MSYKKREGNALKQRRVIVNKRRKNEFLLMNKGLKFNTAKGTGY